MDQFVEFKEKVINNMSQVVIGKEKVMELIIVSFLSKGHILLEDLPGMGKTMMVKAFSKTLGLPFKRIQFTPDLLPSDIMGINYYNQKLGDFQFRKGPIFSNIVLADEINRATPRTQSSLLEAMQEGQVTVDGETRMLNKPFMVLATQNPIESYGTFPLPEAQLDRFFMRIKIGYPTREEEKEIIHSNLSKSIEDLESIVSAEELDYLFENVSKVECSPDVMDYIMDIVDQTRNLAEIQLGVSPRGTIALFKACQAYAAINGRKYIIPEDVKAMVPKVLNHRIIVKGRNNLVDNEKLIERILSTIEVPLERI
ncbi:AAA family ATPase [Tepidimicrobium xylanilyticum]|uniref:MoxR-like ATPase n=1 Tax=Tepidimicrobium xylanilyticum TaxID=1123352 RepID=A0A1H3CCS4_9FIRM|nr:MoxR family ATPase [Tepidimicrobium xylanilyticum]GMG98115.1 ATPase [Tepidimicrobium xylanilyticum]SDX51289.1 MoxR-like ATPase [Tepidimicrobium xylanilyticum]